MEVSDRKDLLPFLKKRKFCNLRDNLGYIYLAAVVIALIFVLAACTTFQNTVIPSTTTLMNGRMGTGTAVSLGNGLWLTKNHVATDDVMSFSVADTTGTVIKRDEKNDLALIKSDYVAPSVRFASEQPKILDRVYLFGFAGQYKKLFAGIGEIRAFDMEYDDRMFIVISGGIMRGMSGSGAYNENMELIGLLDSVGIVPTYSPMGLPVGSFDSNIGFVTPLAVVKQFIEG